MYFYKANHHTRKDDLYIETGSLSPLFSIDKRIKGVNQIESKPNNTALCDKLIYNSICPGLWLPQLWRMVDLSNPVAKQLGIGIETYSFMEISQGIFYIYSAINRIAVIECFRIGLCNISC